MADCPVLIAEDREKGVTAIAHCGIYHINRCLPKELIKCLINKYNSDSHKVYLYIGSHIRKSTYIYDTYPKITTNKEIWKNAIEEANGKYKIDLLQAIINQIQEFELGEIIVSDIDTATNKDYASHYMAYKGKLKKDKI